MAVDDEDQVKRCNRRCAGARSPPCFSAAVFSCTSLIMRVKARREAPPISPLPVAGIAAGVSPENPSTARVIWTSGRVSDPRE